MLMATYAWLRQLASSYLFRNYTAVATSWRKWCRGCGQLLIWPIRGHRHLKPQFSPQKTAKWRHFELKGDEMIADLIHSICSHLCGGYLLSVSVSASLLTSHFVSPPELSSGSCDLHLFSRFLIFSSVSRRSEGKENQHVSVAIFQ